MDDLHGVSVCGSESVSGSWDRSIQNEERDRIPEMLGKKRDEFIFDYHL